MNTAASGTRRKPVAVRGKRMGPVSSSRTTYRAPVSASTVADSEKAEDIESVNSANDVKEHHEGIACNYSAIPQ